MVAKKTVGRKPASARSAATGAAAEGRGGKKGTAAGKPPEPADEAAAGEPSAGTPVKKPTAKRTPAKKAPAKKTPAQKAPAKKIAAKKTPAKKTPAKKTPAKKVAAKLTGARPVGAKKTVAVGESPAAPTALGSAVPPEDLAVRPGEDPWTPEEVAEARTSLESEATRLSTELAASEAALTGLMRDSGDGAGDDDADTGTKNITREHELSLAANAREMLEQTERALLRLDAGTYGICENCGKPIGKARMQAFPRATLCVECKQKQERRG
ncbi:TraR/DksA C4-type zinc finger protein [Streptomyces sp. NPDC004838]